MKTSISLFLSDILPHKKRLYHKIVKSKIFKNCTPDDVFDRLKNLQFDGFELLLPQYSLTTDEDIKEIKLFIKKYQFPVLSVHQALRFFTATRIVEITRLFEIADMLCAKVIVLHMSNARKQIFDEEYITALHELEKKYDIKVTFENMEKHIGSYFSSHRWHANSFSKLIEKTKFHMTFDIVHLAHSGGDILKFFKNNKDKVINVHLSDYKHHTLNGTLRPMRFKHMPLGAGELPIEKFITLLKKENYNGLITLEINSDIRGIEKSASFLNQLKSSKK